MADDPRAPDRSDGAGAGAGDGRATTRPDRARGPGRPSEAAAPVEALRDPVLRAAWASIMEDRSQAEIAALMGVSRASVGNLLARARAEGLVRVSLDPAVLARSALARRIAARFGLEAVYLVPEGGDPMDRVTRAAASWVDDLLGGEGTLGVAWGETIHRLAGHLPRRAWPGLTVVQLVGSMASPFGFTAEICTALIAERLGAVCVNLHAPAVLSDPALVAALLREPILRRQVAALERCDAALFAVGLATAESHVVQSGVATPEELARYAERGATAVIAGRFIDAEGRALAGPLDGRLVGLPLDGLRRIPRRLVVSAGVGRAGALRAALLGGFATHLVTDAASGEALVAAGGPPPA